MTLIVTPEWWTDLERVNIRVLEDADCPKCHIGRDIGWIVVRLWKGKTWCDNCCADLDVQVRHSP